MTSVTLDAPAAATAPLLLRDTTPEDAAALSAIYAPEVLDSLHSFEVEPPDAAEMAARFAAIRAAGYPHRVAVLDDCVVGYAYVSAYRTRPAYRFTVENSIYIDRAFHRRGIGRALLADIIDTATRMGFREMIAVIGDSENLPSIALHRAAGFEMTGVLRNIGHKFDRWVDVVQMQKSLTPA